MFHVGAAAQLNPAVGERIGQRLLFGAQRLRRGKIDIRRAHQRGAPQVVGLIGDARALLDESFDLFGIRLNDGVDDGVILFRLPFELVHREVDHHREHRGNHAENQRVDQNKPVFIHDGLASVGVAAAAAGGWWVRKLRSAMTASGLRAARIR